MAKNRWLAAVSLLALLATESAAAQAPTGQAAPLPVLMTADQMEHDRDRNVVTAHGNVEITQQGRVLNADKVIYDMNADRLFAYGHVIVVEPSGEVLFSDQSEVTGDFKTGVVQNIRVLLTNDARLAANVGRRIGGEVMELEQSSYTACQPCKEDPSQPLLWEIQAKQVVHDQQTHDIVFYDAWLNVYGWPVAYTPWFSTPDATVKQRSGFLPPSIGSNKDIGYTLAVPYYWAISPQEDLTFTPRFSDQQLPILSFEHHKIFSFGEIQTDASLTEDETGDVRGHIRSKGKFNIDKTYRGGYELGLTSDGTYLKRYEFLNSGMPFLTNRPYLEGFYNGRSYALAESFYFQGQRTSDVQGEIPIVGPLLTYSYVGQPGSAFGGRFGLDANFVQLTRTESYDSIRAYVRPYWTMPYTSSRGEIYTFTAALPTVFEQFSDYNSTSDTSGHVIPEATVEWRYPFIRMGTTTQQVLEPIVQMVLAPHWTGDIIKNPDALTFDFTDTSLFQLSHFAGYDGYSSGPRLNYALKYTLNGWKNGSVSALLGQSYRVYADDGLSAGLDQNLSDFVGRLTVSPTENVDIYYRFLLGKDDLSLLRSEVTAVVGPPILRLSADYSYIDKSVSTSSIASDELSLGISSALSQRWSVSAYTRYDLTSGGGLLYNGGAITYNDECFTLSMNVLNNMTSDTDVSSGQTYLLRLAFKTLGEAPVTIH